MSANPNPKLVEKLLRSGHEHLLAWWPELPPAKQQALASQLDKIDFRQLHEISQPTGGDGESAVEKAARAEPPATVVRLPKTSADQDIHTTARNRGLALLAAGRVGCILVAGGQGSRLGFPHPKGMFPIGPVSRNSLFQILAEQLLARSRQAGKPIPYFIMTSDATHDETVAFFQQNHFFGLDPADVFFFQQGTMPAVDSRSGKVLLAEKDQVVASPDGHGGMLRAIERSGCLEEMSRRGIETLYYHQVDNPTAVVCDPVFLGFHDQRESEASTKVAAKRSADEKMGLVADIDGQTQVIEYSDLPADIAAQTDETGGLRLWAGNTAIHAFQRTFFERLLQDEIDLPFHLARKVVPFIDEQGRKITPDFPNATKFEKFIFDALPKAAQTLVFEIDRAVEFNPVKNRSGSDSPETAQTALLALHRSWLVAAGIPQSPEVAVEISPLFAVDGAELAERLTDRESFSEPTYLR